jgi:IclR family pca regulon transcriptional regulator
MSTPKMKLKEAQFGEGPDFMQSLARGLMVLRVFERHSTITVSDGAQATSLSRATVRRCLLTLERCGYVSQEEGGLFRLRPTLLPLARAFLSSSRIVEVAAPYLVRIRDSVGESCSLGILDGHDIVYIGRAETTRIMSIALQVGSYLPAYCTSMGRVLLAAQPREQVEKFLSLAPFPARTIRTLTTAAALREELARVAANGYALVDEELEIGLRSIAIPIRDSLGVVIAALNVGAPAPRMSVTTLVNRIKSDLLAVGEEIGRQVR